MRDFLHLLIAEVRGSWRFRWLAIGTAWLVCLVGWAVVYAVPDTYESEAVVLFDASSDLSELLESMTVNSDILSRVEGVRMAMLGRDSLERVARETVLDSGEQGSERVDAAVGKLRSGITISSDRQRGGNIYRIQYRDADPQTAYEVVSTLVKTFVEETVGANREESVQAQTFLRKEIESLEGDLTEAEQRLAEFKRENVGRMPGESGDYFARLQSEMEALEATEAQLRQANRRLATLRQQLAGEQPTLDVDSPLAALDRRIAEKEQRLEELKLRYTEFHPDVIAMQETIEQLREQKADAVKTLNETDAMEIVSDNPVFQNIQIEVAKINVEIASLREQARTHREKIRNYRELVDVLPQVEAELARLNRDYDVKQVQYRALLQKLEIAELSDAAGQSGGVRFQVIDPPREPLEPVAPHRPVLLAGVLFLGFAAGGGFAFVTNQLKPVFLDSKTLTKVTGLPVLGSVQRIENRERRHQRMTELGMFSGVVALLGVAFVVVVLFHDPGGEFVRSLLDGMTAA